MTAVPHGCPAPPRRTFRQADSRLAVLAPSAHKRPTTAGECRRRPLPDFALTQGSPRRDPVRVVDQTLGSPPSSCWARSSPPNISSSWQPRRRTCSRRSRTADNRSGVSAQTSWGVRFDSRASSTSCRIRGSSAILSPTADQRSLEDRRRGAKHLAAEKRASPELERCGLIASALNGTWLPHEPEDALLTWLWRRA